MNLFRLKNFTDKKTERLRSILLNLNLDLDDIWNPCYKKFNKNHYISFRANYRFKHESESFIHV